MRKGLRTLPEWIERLEDKEKIDKVIRGDEADVVLALLSTGSLESDFCRGEQLRSLRRHKCVIPVLVHDKADRPVYLEARQYRDFAVSALLSVRAVYVLATARPLLLPLVPT